MKERQSTRPKGSQKRHHGSHKSSRGSRASAKKQQGPARATADTFFKRSLLELDIVRDIIRSHLPRSVVLDMDLMTLDPRGTEYLTAALRRRISDGMFSVERGMRDGKRRWALIYIEQQTVPEEGMALRMGEMVFSILRQVMDSESCHSGDGLPLVIPILLSNHTSPYPYSPGFLELFASEDRPFMASLFQKGFLLIDVPAQSDHAIERHRSASALEWAFKHVKRSRLQEVLGRSLQLLGQSIRKGYFPKARARKYARYLIYYLLDNVQQLPPKAKIEGILAEVQAKLLPEVGKTMTTLRQYFERKAKREGKAEGRIEGRVEGRVEGRKEGREEVRQEFAKKLLLEGMDEATISRLTELSVTELQSLKPVAENLQSPG